MVYLGYFDTSAKANGKSAKLPFVGHSPKGGLVFQEQTGDLEDTSAYIDVAGDLYIDHYEDIGDASVLALVKTAYSLDGDHIMTSDVIDDDMTATKGYIFSGQDIENVYGIGNLVKNCSVLGDGTNHKGLFMSCTNLKSVDVKDWNISGITDLTAMFMSCSSLKTVKNIEKLNVSDVSVLYATFANCSKIEYLNLSNWNVSNVTNMFAMFDQCYVLKSVGDLSNWNVSNVTNMKSLFHCTPIPVLNLNNWNTSKVTTMSNIFGRWSIAAVRNGYCTLEDLKYQDNLKEIHIKNWDTTACTNMHMFDSIDDESNPYINLTIFEFGEGFFNTSLETLDTCADLCSWSHDSMIESLYTNQLDRDVTKTKTLQVHPDALARLSEEEIANIAALGITLATA